MNREEAIRRINDHMRVHGLNEPNAIYITEALKMALDTLLGPQPDPITGLVPCGCGGDAVRNGMSFFCAYVTSCSECGTLAWSKASQQEADNNWNTSRGYTAPTRPGAIGPDAGEMAPNGEEGATHGYN